MDHPIACSDCGEALESQSTRGEEGLCPSCVRKRDQKRGRSLLERVRRKNREFFGTDESNSEQDRDL